MVLEHFPDLFGVFLVKENEEEVEIGGDYKSLMEVKEVGFFFFMLVV